MRPGFLLFKNFLRHPLTVSSVVPSSRFVVRRLCALIETAGDKVIVEEGPGTGVLAREIVKEGKLTPGSQLILIEKTKELAESLKETFADDPRIRVFHDSAENIAKVLFSLGIAKADYIVCGIPLSVMPRSLRKEILGANREALKPHGVFIGYMARPGIRALLKEYFPVLRLSFEWRNFPPLFIVEGRKG